MAKKVLLVLVALVLVISTPFLVSERSFNQISNMSTEIGGGESVSKLAVADDFNSTLTRCSDVTDRLETPCDESRRIPRFVSSEELAKVRQCGVVVLANGDKFVAGEDGGLDLVRSHLHVDRNDFCAECVVDEIGRHQISNEGLDLGWKTNGDHDFELAPGKDYVRKAMAEALAICQKKPVGEPYAVTGPAL
ncbi:MAG: hypothetical protein M3M85_00585 [bacterium]|nr:hypothetical protein [bacterium]